jgi:hypothetical protein
VHRQVALHGVVPRPSMQSLPPGQPLRQSLGRPNGRARAQRSPSAGLCHDAGSARRATSRNCEKAYAPSDGIPGARQIARNDSPPLSRSSTRAASTSVYELGRPRARNAGPPFDGQALTLGGIGSGRNVRFCQVPSLAVGRPACRRRPARQAPMQSATPGATLGFDGGFPAAVAIRDAAKIPTAQGEPQRAHTRAKVGATHSFRHPKTP